MKFISILLLLFIIGTIDCKNRGVLKYENGDIYEGFIKMQKPHGKGKFQSKEMVYEGDFIDGKKHGHGTQTFIGGFIAGEKYIGEWKDDEKSGHGIYTWPDGKKYIGSWETDKQSGQGSLTNAEGDKYVGQFKDGKPDGDGIYTGKDGKIIHNGKWRKGKPVKE